MMTTQEPPEHQLPALLRENNSKYCACNLGLYVAYGRIGEQGEVHLYSDDQAEFPVQEYLVPEGQCPELIAAAVQSYTAGLDVIHDELGGGDDYGRPHGQDYESAIPIPDAPTTCATADEHGSCVGIKMPFGWDAILDYPSTEHGYLQIQFWKSQEDSANGAEPAASLDLYSHKQAAKVIGFLTGGVEIIEDQYADAENTDEIVMKLIKLADEERGFAPCDSCTI